MTADPHGPAVGAIVRQLARARDDGADDDFTARTILTALIGHGWRRVIEPPPGPGGQALDPVDVAAAAAKARAAIQRFRGRAACPCGPGERCVDCATDDELAAAIPPPPDGQP